MDLPISIFRVKKEYPISSTQWLWEIEYLNVNDIAYSVVSKYFTDHKIWVYTFVMEALRLKPRQYNRSITISVSIYILKNN